MFKDFKAFVMRGSVVDMAVGIIVGAAFSGVVNSLVNNIIMPPIGVLLGQVDFSDLFVNLSRTQYPSLDAAKRAGAATIAYGVFINTIINFLIVAFAVFVLVRMLNKLYSEAPPAPTTRDCPYCASAIPLAAVRCPHCTSELTAAA
ncbi:MAG TPA: large conductance mechanosensitive channel protein MscL [Candidatus Binataceae bacterium]|nr:large conductance mechanosensitive channel protein MscL [Candidatus Binataceae bacterium]